MICEEECNTRQKFVPHLRIHHKTYNRKSYYDEFFKQEDEGSCKVCKSETRFVKDSYLDFCSASCRTFNSRKTLREDPARFEAFKRKVKSNMKDQWKNQDQSSRIANMTNAVRNHVMQLTPEERKKFSPKHHMTSEEWKKHCIDKKSTGMFKFWREISDDERKEIIEKRAKTLRETWRVRGKEIHDKIIRTTIMNGNVNHFFPISQKNLDLMNERLSEFFSVEPHDMRND